MDRIDRIDAYREIIKENIEFEALVQRYGYERVDELVELMLQTVLSQRPYIRIAGDDYPREVVKSRFLKVKLLPCGVCVRLTWITTRPRCGISSLTCWRLCIMPRLPWTAITGPKSITIFTDRGSGFDDRKYRRKEAARMKNHETPKQCRA